MQIMQKIVIVALALVAAVVALPTNEVEDGFKDAHYCSYIYCIHHHHGGYWCHHHHVCDTENLVSIQSCIVELQIYHFNILYLFSPREQQSQFY